MRLKDRNTRNPADSHRESQDKLKIKTQNSSKYNSAQTSPKSTDFNNNENLKHKIALTILGLIPD